MGGRRVVLGGNGFCGLRRGKGRRRGEAGHLRFEEDGMEFDSG